ncbi:prolyl 4-hydroxylase subunit alpha-2-like isoform X3 [Mercenaria mercenaria]|uniref:prolyl 4-hydroxylase subunit alpha-2-like isoform X3 n=1 Tax=Mercenaria mercenaria TaxID=6596 RepID=UPI00234E6D04|nr:prolyl 4-hydroxylase subunit alpha-2-like isoform X3 [Mercenaria mercenaria]
MNFSKVLVVFINSYWIQLGLCKFYSSSFEISKLLETENKILQKLNVYFERQEKKGVTFDNNVKKFVNYAEIENNHTREIISTTENPLAVFYLLSRAVNKWSELTKNLSCNEEHEECPILTGADIINVNKRREASEWPTEAEVKEAAKAIVNVWTVYDLDLENIINGILEEVTERPLLADEIFAIANAARDSGMTYEAITWYEYLLHRLESTGSYTFKTSSLYRRLALTYKENGMLSRAIELLQNYLKIDSGDTSVARDLDFLKQGSSKDNVKELVRFAANDTSRLTRSRQKFEELCRSSMKGTNNSRHLHCSLFPLYNWYGQVKVETISKRPEIQILYDVLSLNETDKIISYGEKAFTQFYQMFPFKTKPTALDHRLKSGPMCEWNPHYPLMINLTRRLEQMTRYHMFPASDVTSSECYTMTNEGPGLIHNPVLDSWPKGHHTYPFAGNRLATIMLQLSDVKYGGSVVFPKLNLTVPVHKGSAVVWRNLKEDGTPSARALHSSCPVMIGSRWALYKHILYNNQVFRRPCEAK